MIIRVMIVGFLMFGVVAIGQTPLFRLDSLPTNTVLLKHAPSITSLDGLKKLPSQQLKRFDMQADFMVDEKQVSSQQKGNTMPIYPVKSNDEMKVVIPDTMTKQYLQIHGVDTTTSKRKPGE